ncbi:MAG TPA: hypothetical protein VJZ71_09510 [Phycisphaerae bacterium]|nr:hypothetical protein [Phycisphaerae bacterium]
MLLTDLPKGTPLRIHETIGSPSLGTWTSTVEGKLVDCYVEPSSALQNDFATSPSGEYPLLRLRIEEGDGSLTDLVLDEHTVIEKMA